MTQRNKVATLKISSRCSTIRSSQLKWNKIVSTSSGTSALLAGMFVQSAAGGWKNWNSINAKQTKLNWWIKLSIRHKLFGACAFGILDLVIQTLFFVLVGWKRESWLWVNWRESKPPKKRKHKKYANQYPCWVSSNFCSQLVERVFEVVSKPSKTRWISG